MENTIGITEVAIYLRKSRGESENDLKKHRTELVNLADKNGWKPFLYEEIASGEDIDWRPKMQELLSDIADDMYDAVLVMDIDRLGRGDEADTARYKKIIRESNTFIVTPQKVFNLRDESDEMLTDFLGVMARFEYKQIKKRLRRGKQIGAKLGYWTNGVPPFPYVYDSQQKGLVVNEEQRSLFTYIKDGVLRGHALKRMAIDLNRQGYRTNKGKLWTEVAIHRLVTNEVHLGRIVYGKTKGSGHVNKKTTPLTEIPRSEWTVVENAHEPVMTQDEFDTIQATLKRNQLVKHRARHGARKLSGLIKCAKCGYGMSFVHKKADAKVYIKPCQHHDGFGNVCGNSGCNADAVLEYLYKYLNEYEAVLTAEREVAVTSDEKERLSILLPKREIDLAKLQASLKRIRELYEIGDYTREEFFGRRDERNAEIKQCEQDIEEIRQQIDYYENLSANDRINNARTLLEMWSSDDEAAINRALKQVFSRIELRRDGRHGDIHIKAYVL